MATLRGTVHSAVEIVAPEEVLEPDQDTSSMDATAGDQVAVDKMIVPTRRRRNAEVGSMLWNVETSVL